VEGIDLTRAWRGEATAVEQDAVFVMNFTYRFNHCQDMLKAFMKIRNDNLWSGAYYKDWFDEERQVVRNTYGPLGDPESGPATPSGWGTIAGG
jgi:hypothetical protein